MKTIYINGKFLAQSPTGVQRYASQLVQAVDRLLAAQRQRVRWVLLHPTGSSSPPLQCIACRQVGLPGMPLHFWEQVVLPWAARGSMLLSLAGSAPLSSGRQICTLHDAAVFEAAQAYTWAFITWYRLLFRLAARRAVLLLTVSDFSRRRLTMHLGLSPARIAVVPDGADHLLGVSADESVIDRLALRGARFFLAVGSSNPNKNIGSLKAAFSHAFDSSALRLVLVGSANSAVFAHHVETQLDPRILYAGSVTDGELVALYRHAVGLVFPSLYEGFGLPPLEAMGLGCPVAAAQAGAIAEVCGDAVMYFDPRSQPSIEHALLALLAAGPAVQRLRSVGLAHASRWTWEGSAESLVRHVEDAA